jgi:hypothetical protein
VEAKRVYGTGKCTFVFRACTPQDLTPSVLNQIALRDQHWLLLPVEHVLMYSVCDLVQVRPSTATWLL